MAREVISGDIIESNNYGKVKILDVIKSYNNSRHTMVLCMFLNTRNKYIFYKDSAVNGNIKDYYMLRADDIITNDNKINIIKEHFSSNGYTLVEYEGEDIYFTTDLFIKDAYGYIYKTSLIKFYNKTKLIKFHKSNKYTIDNIKTYIKNNNINATLLSEEYVKKRDKLILKNNINNKIYNVSLRAIFNNKNIFTEEINKNSVVKLAKEKFGLVNIDDKEYRKIETKFSWTDGKYLYYYSYKDIEANKSVLPFSVYNIYTDKNIDKFIKENNYNVKRLTTYKHTDKLIKFKCLDCENIWETSFSILRSSSIGCPVCAARSHRGGFNLETAKRFKDDWLKIKSNLYIFKIYNKNEKFYKIGITTKKDPKDRFKKEYMYSYKFDLLFSKENNLYQNVLLESYLHKELDSYSYIPEDKISGYTECYSYDLKCDYIIKIIEGDDYEVKEI